MKTYCYKTIFFSHCALDPFVFSANKMQHVYVSVFLVFVFFLYYKYAGHVHFILLTCSRVVACHFYAYRLYRFLDDVFATSTSLYR